MAALIDRLRERIRREGPITFYDWMNAALYDPEHGYYCRSDRRRWGREGDYRTSPERSAVFAATFARYFARLFADLGSPPFLTIVEVGGGSGHFAAVVLDTLQRRYPNVFAATRYYFDEVSTDTRRRARQQLERFEEKIEFKRLADLDRLDPGIIFSNELLDSFPVHRVIMQAGKLRELYVSLDSAGNFEWMIDEPSTERLNHFFSNRGISLAESQKAEVNLNLEDWLELAAEKISKGFMITVDYGAEASELYDSAERSDGTLRAFGRHQFAKNVLELPGEQDITSSVDWTFVKAVGARQGFSVVAFERQDRFLISAGLLEEMELMMTEIGQEAERLRLRTSAREMIIPGGMAESFQVLVQKKEKRD